METLEKTISCDTQMTAIELIAQATKLSKTKIKRAMTLGAVWTSKRKKITRLRRAKTHLQPGDRISIYYSEKILSFSPPEPDLINDQETYSVWNKPAGLMSSGTRFGDHCAINRVVEKLFDRPVFLVHRLDKFANGVMVLAHTKSAAANLSKQFQQRTVQKQYRALVEGELTSPVTIETPLDGKEAISRITPIDSSSGNTLVEIQIDTGRKHQIRRHMALLGNPVIGDQQYGAGRYSQLILAAVALAFDCPNTGNRVSFDLPPEGRPRLADLPATQD